MFREQCNFGPFWRLNRPKFGLRYLSNRYLLQKCDVHETFIKTNRFCWFWAPGMPHDAPRPPQDGPKTAPSPPKTPPSGPKKPPRGPKKFHLSPQISVSQLCSMLLIFVIEITFASSQESINKVQEVSKINISEPPSFRASTPLSLQVPRRDSRSANNFE